MEKNFCFSGFVHGYQKKTEDGIFPYFQKKYFPEEYPFSMYNAGIKNRRKEIPSGR